MSPVLVVWHDAFADTSSWMEVADIDDEPCVVNSVGFLIPDAKQGHVVIAMSNNSHDYIDSVLAIPVGMVQQITLLS